jgi:hypothetical protein
MVSRFCWWRVFSTKGEFFAEKSGFSRNPVFGGSSGVRVVIDDHFCAENVVFTYASLCLITTVVTELIGVLPQAANVLVNGMTGRYRMPLRTPPTVARLTAIDSGGLVCRIFSVGWQFETTVPRFVVVSRRKIGTRQLTPNLNPAQIVGTMNRERNPLADALELRIQLQVAFGVPLREFERALNGVGSEQYNPLLIETLTILVTMQVNRAH